MNFGHVRHLHFAGIGGAGMCGLAELLFREGLEVSGCDLQTSEATARLQRLGIPVALGHDPAHLAGADVLVISSAVPGSNPEVEAARAAGVPVIRRAEMLGEVSRLKWTVAVAGTHGKTTTTSLTGHVLTEAGLDPTVAVGGRVHLLGAHARLGRSQYLVCEADEYDRSFLALYPVLAVITNVEAEHLDTYGTVEAMEDAYVEFAGRTPFYGATIACLDDPGVRRLLPRLGRRIVTYGESPQADVAGREVSLSPTACRCRVVARGEDLGTLEVPLPGRHVLANALAAVTVALEIGVPYGTAAAAIAAFTGVARRFERKGERGGAILIDDYAHHPTEVAATLQAARQAFPASRLVAVFQPHLYSRTQAFARQLGEALLGADLVLVLPVYAAREQPIPGVTHQLVVDAARRSGHRQVLPCDSFEAALSALEGAVGEGDVVLTLGAGNVVRLGEAWLGGGAA
ncbi:MAG TPA: UDP-N-acetylmuramate--L-alanine ligase [Thermoanaerobaculaceae bacterium]|nr:UDP-N-acetylmuramate--L-alanine ligase [Thermoanaerobaculaceae bacterium]HRS16344.1 UDP-N-acetylmuramate--L-alanine ligase [Thermoanaerobaculaceae bacterium]